MTIKNIQSITVLQSSQMAMVKGGGTKQAVDSVTSALPATTQAVDVLTDDKRPPRPGGGITTL